MPSPAGKVSLGLGDGRFPDGIHVCHVFNDDEERSKTLARYFQQGLREGERALCLIDAMSTEEVQGCLADAGVDLSAIGPQFGIAKAEPVYCAGGEFVPDVCLSSFGQFSVQSRTDGYTGTRIMGDMAWALRRGTSHDLLLEYEAKVKDYVERYPVTATCEYDARRFDGGVILDILAMHPATIVRGQIILNPFYDDPNDYLARYRARQPRPA
jgi:hypothetical protein